MKYYHIHYQSIYNSIYQDIYIKAENKNEAECFAKTVAHDILDWEEEIFWNIEEITKEEYEENT